VDRLLQARAPREVPEPPRPLLEGTKTAGETKKTNDVAVADRLLSQIAEIDTMFWESKK